MLRSHNSSYIRLAAFILVTLLNCALTLFLHKDNEQIDRIEATTSEIT